ncbi:hypothetical protein IGI04_017823 [Brassica rapa subsp. trilocularis]|uniref:Prolamin-like domain-containing protein n=1 Tax=Brassica rapa subsp. trilocularis TaxID=1813537 RepID=A0ABQ7MB59_BRACM|nr:hypothetical protein IGI04_017823 [Brassica rapa subsp. trilocularis]
MLLVRKFCIAVGMVMVMTITTTVDSSKPPSRSHGDATEQLLDKSNQSLPPVVGRERGCLAFVMEKIQGQNKLCLSSFPLGFCKSKMLTCITPFQNESTMD